VSLFYCSARNVRHRDRETELGKRKGTRRKRCESESSRSQEKTIGGILSEKNLEL
jgi:hypothetical protein